MAKPGRPRLAWYELSHASLKKHPARYRDRVLAAAAAAGIAIPAASQPTAPKAAAPAPLAPAAAGPHAPGPPPPAHFDDELRAIWHELLILAQALGVSLNIVHATQLEDACVLRAKIRALGRNAGQADIARQHSVLEALGLIATAPPARAPDAPKNPFTELLRSRDEAKAKWSGAEECDGPYEAFDPSSGEALNRWTGELLAENPEPADASPPHPFLTQQK